MGNKGAPVAGFLLIACLAALLIFWFLAPNRGKTPTGASVLSTQDRSSSQQANDKRGKSSLIRLRDVTRDSGITFVHTDGSSGRRYIIEAMSAGLALFDYNGDDLIDIYCLNGAPLLGTKVETPPTNALYRNDGNLHFTDVTEQAGVGDKGFGLGVTVGDYDNDGDPDLYLNNFGPNVLYRNNGDGTFTDVATEAGVRNGNLVGAGACFFDIENDGDLDLYAANYVKFSYDLHVERTFDGIPSYPIPKDYDPIPDTLFRNNGDGTFTDVSIDSGVGLHAGTGMGTVAADYDDDGDTDIFVCNDVEKNFLFLNDGTGHFEEVGVFVGSAYNKLGEENASMGVDCADYDNDGRLDFFMTSYQAELPVLYRNIGNGLLADVTQSSGAGEGTFPHVNWGTGFVDFDNDGDRDILIANGHTEDNIELRDKSATYRARNVLLENTGDGRFINVSNSAGDGLLPVHASRGTAFDDLDNDGDIDAVIVNIRETPTLLRNDSAGNNHWLQIRLRGVHTNRDGVGTRVKVVAGDLTQIDEVHSGRGYQSHWGSRLQFGLGSHDHVDRVEVHWLGGAVDTIEHVAVDQLLTIVESDRK